MRGFILAAGFGTRLKPLTEHIPKALVPVCGKPLLARNLEHLQNSGAFTSLGVNSHYLNDQLLHFRSQSPVPFELFYEEGKIRGTGGALYFAKDFLAGDDSFFIANVDILNNFDLAAMAEQFLSSGRICSLVSVPVQSGGTVIFDYTSSDYLGVTAEESSYPGASKAEFTGAAFYKREFLDFLREDDFSIIPVWKRVSQNGNNPGIIAPRNSSWWRDIGTPSALARVHFDVLDGTLLLDIPESMVLNKEDRVCAQAHFHSVFDQYTWYEPDSAPSGYTISRSIVLGQALVLKNLNETILTEWGEIKF